MLQNVIVAIVVLGAVLYAVRALAPSAWLGGHVVALSNALHRRGWIRSARLVAAYAPSGEGCGGCGSCDVNAKPAAPAAQEKPLVFHRQPRR